MFCLSVRIAVGCLIASIALSSAAAGEIIGKIPGAQTAAGIVQVSLADARAKIARVTRARRHFERDAGAYWKSVAEMRNVRATKRRNNETILITDYVLTQPPGYKKVAELEDCDDLDIVAGASPRIPVASDFLNAASTHFEFSPLRPLYENDYKQSYAKVAAANGVSQQQAVKIYAFESGGNGTYDVQAGLEYPVPGARAISTALGYNQLLAANTINLFTTHGDRIVQLLANKSMQLPEEARLPIEQKILVVKRMVALARTTGGEWSEQMRLGSTPKGLALHAMIFDVEVGPILQMLKLVNSLNYARQKGYYGILSAAELEMMNLTGDRNGFDIVLIPDDLRDRIPTANFFQRRGYELNSIATANPLVSKLLAATEAKMDEESKLRGAVELASYF
jgi:hypothetical protein